MTTEVMFEDTSYDSRYDNHLDCHNAWSEK